MSEASRITIVPADAGQRLDRFLAARPGFGTRSQVQRRISEVHIRLDGVAVKAGTVLRAGQTIEIDPAERDPPSSIEAQAIPLRILFEDDSILVINKPAGLVVHPAPGNRRGTVVNALLHHWGGVRADLDPTRPGIVHRLDKETSGVLVIAKDATTLAALATQFHDRLVEKRYVAIVWGKIAADHGTIREPIGRNPKHRKQMAVRRNGRAAETTFQVIERFDAVTIVRLQPRTGRTHQIRVHLASIGHPVVGDATYGRGQQRNPALMIARHALHAERLTFHHPRTQAKLTFVAPLPDDMKEFRSRLRGDLVPDVPSGGGAQ